LFFSRLFLRPTTKKKNRWGRGWSLFLGQNTPFMLFSPFTWGPKGLVSTPLGGFGDKQCCFAFFLPVGVGGGSRGEDSFLSKKPPFGFFLEKHPPPHAFFFLGGYVPVKTKTPAQKRLRTHNQTIGWPPSTLYIYPKTPPPFSPNSFPCAKKVCPLKKGVFFCGGGPTPQKPLVFSIPPPGKFIILAWLVRLGG